MATHGPRVERGVVVAAAPAPGKATEYVIRRDQGGDAAVLQWDEPPLKIGARVLLIIQGDQRASVAPDPGTSAAAAEPSAERESVGPYRPIARVAPPAAPQPAPPITPPSLAPAPPPAPVESAAAPPPMPGPIVAGLPPAPPPPAPASAAPASPPQAPTPRVNGRKGHLASYHSAAEAEADWRQLSSQEDILRDAAHAVESVDLGPKGVMWRLYIVGAADDVYERCQELQRRRRYCVLY